MHNVRPSHSLGAGVLLGLAASSQPHAIAYASLAGFVAGALVTVAAFGARRTFRFFGNVARRLERGHELELEPDDVPAAVGLAYLSQAEAEAHRLEGLRQGEAAGVRAAARAEVRDSAKRAMIEQALDDHWQAMTSARVRAGGAS